MFPSSWSSPTASSSRPRRTNVRSTRSSTNIEDKLREAGHKPVRREGTREGRWTLLDYVDVVIHVQHDEERNFYALERLWKDCPTVPVEGIGAARRQSRPARTRRSPVRPDRAATEPGNADEPRCAG